MSSSPLHRPAHGGYPTPAARPLRSPPPPEDPVYPPLHPRYGGLDEEDLEAGIVAEAERLLGHWPASEQHDYPAALELARRRLR